MRDFYTVPDSPTDAEKSIGVPYERRTLQIVTLAFWGPCCVADLWLLAQGGSGVGGFVFWLLFRQALVFLALWSVSAAAHGLMRGSRADKGPTASQRRKLRARLADSFKGYVAPTRGNRGQ